MKDFFPWPLKKELNERVENKENSKKKNQVQPKFNFFIDSLDLFFSDFIGIFGRKFKKTPIRHEGSGCFEEVVVVSSPSLHINMDFRELFENTFSYTYSG